MSEQNLISCQDCKHIILSGDSQEGCQLNLLDNLEAQKTDKYYEFNRVCMFKNKDVDEVDVKLGYIFILDDFSKLDILQNNLTLIKDKAPMWIGVSSNDPTKNTQIAETLDTVGCKYNIISNFNEVDNIYKLDQFMKNYKNGWTLVNIVGQDFDPDVKNKLNQFVLKNGKKAALIKDTTDPDDFSVNGICYFNFIYKYLNGSKAELNEEENVYYTKSFPQKIAEQSPQMIVAWSEL